MRQTTMLKQHLMKEEWFLVDARNKVLGKVASTVAHYLRGKNRRDFTPNVNTLQKVIVLNAKKIVLTADKENKKIYYSHSGYPGALKAIKAGDFKKKKPLEIVRKAIMGMIPHNHLGRKLKKNLYIYENDTHDFKTKKIKEIKIR